MLSLLAIGADGYGEAALLCAAGGYADGYGDADGYLLCAADEYGGDVAEYGVADVEYEGGYLFCAEDEYGVADAEYGVADAEYGAVDVEYDGGYALELFSRALGGYGASYFCGFAGGYADAPFGCAVDEYGVLYRSRFADEYPES